MSPEHPKIKNRESENPFVNKNGIVDDTVNYLSELGDVDIEQFLKKLPADSETKEKIRTRFNGLKDQERRKRAEQMGNTMGLGGVQYPPGRAMSEVDKWRRERLGG